MLFLNTDYKIFINDEELESTVHDTSELKRNFVYVVASMRNTFMDSAIMELVSI